ncbi:MAG: DUF1361 domain-containing protein [Chitinophagaceae bacterium]
MSTHIFIKRVNNQTLTLRQWIFISCCFSILLVGVRVLVTGYITYLFLIWNLFLAFIPYAISEWFSSKITVIESRIKRVATLAVWLLFIPNSFYIITDLYHLVQFDSAPKWFDLLMVFSFAWNGLLFGVLSVRKIKLIVTLISGWSLSLFFIAAVMWLNAFGIYVGRILRFNSWDIIVQPFSLVDDILYILCHPIRNKMEWGMITTWAVFMTLFYITIEKLGESFLPRHSSKN